MAQQAVAPVVTIWLIPFGHGALVDIDVGAILPPGEIERAERFIHARLKQRYLAAHVAMRLILSRMTGEPPGALPLCRNAWGKPRWRPHFRGVSFNMSYGAHEAVLALVQAGEIGVDIEDVARFRGWALAGALMTGREKRDLDSLPAALHESAICKWWTSKEAVLKATGYGLTQPLDSFGVDVDPCAPPQILEHCPLTENIVLSATALDGGRARLAVATCSQIGAVIELRPFQWRTAAQEKIEPGRLAGSRHG